MSTHRSTDPWRKNMTTPRSRHEAFGESEYLSPVDYGELSKVEKLVLLLGCLGVGVFMIYAYYFA
jgi:hypothetical protein